METNEERKYCVYIHTNKINNKVYIGQTGKSLNDRWRKDGSGYLQKRKNGVYYQPLFARAIQKYGWDNFEHIIFAECLTKSKACHIEKLLIALYKSNNSTYGYNLSSGGESGSAGCVMTDDRKQKISELIKKCWEDDNYRQNQIESHKWQAGENHPWFGRHHSERTKEKIRQAHTKFFVWCMELNELFYSPEDVKRKLGIDASDVRKVCKGLKKSAGKHPITGEKLHWEFVDKEVVFYESVVI